MSRGSTRIAPSILAADFTRLGDELAAIETKHLVIRRVGVKDDSGGIDKRRAIRHHRKKSVCQFGHFV